MYLLYCTSYWGEPSVSASLLVVGTISGGGGCKIYNLAAQLKFDSRFERNLESKFTILATERERKEWGLGKIGLQDDRIRVG